MLVANHQTELRELVGKQVEGLEGQKGIATPLEEEHRLACLNTQFSQRLDYQPRSVPVGIHAFRSICSRGWPCLTAMGGAALGEV